MLDWPLLALVLSKSLVLLLLITDILNDVVGIE